MNGEDFKITIEGADYRNIEDIPERYREIVRRQLEAARSAAETAAAASAKAAGQGGNVQIKKHFEIKLNIKRGVGVPPETAKPSISPIIPSNTSDRAKLILIALVVLAAILWKLFKH